MWRPHHKYLSIYSLYLFTRMHRPMSPIKNFLKGETSHRLWKKKNTKKNNNNKWTRGRILMLTQLNP